MVITNEALADAILNATANDDMLTQWAYENSRNSAVGFQTMHEKSLIEAIHLRPERLLDAPVKGVALLFSFAPFDALLPMIKVGVQEPDFITQLVDRLNIAFTGDDNSSKESLWNMIATRAVTRLSAMQKIDLLRSVHVTTAPIMTDLAKRMPITFSATVT